MLSLDSVDKFNIEERGDVYICRPSKDLTHGQLEQIIGNEVEIDSAIYKVNGVERYSIPYEPYHKVICAFGVLVYPRKKGGTHV